MRPGASYFLGRVGYEEAARLQHALHAERVAGRREDSFLFLEHPPVITMGRGAHEEHLLGDAEALRAAGAEIWETTRGGDVTYHGPGQLVGYGILDLKQHGRDLGRYLRLLEEALLRVLAEYGFQGSRKSGLTGAWVGDRKVAAIGVRADRWVTSHGFALNVEPNLAHFEWIVPCGIRDYGVTSLAELVRERDPNAAVPGLQEVARHAEVHLGEVFDMEFRRTDAAALEGLAAPEGPVLGGIRRIPSGPESSGAPDSTR
jgi:lipoyl(octanoyl) transferase